jgi:hypothetical protein
MTTFADSRTAFGASTVAKAPRTHNPGVSSVEDTWLPLTQVVMEWSEALEERPRLNLTLLPDTSPIVQQAILGMIQNFNRMLLARTSGRGREEEARTLRAMPYLLRLVQQFRAAPDFFPLDDGGLLAKFVLPMGDIVRVEVDAEDDIVILTQDADGHYWSGYADRADAQIGQIAERYGS